jgi:hypothetical protein
LLAPELDLDLPPDFEPGRAFGLAFPGGVFDVGGLIFRAMALL